MTILSEIYLDENTMVSTIKDLMCMGNKGKWIAETDCGILRVGFEGDFVNVQKRILAWLSVPERSQQLEDSK